MGSPLYRQQLVAPEGAAGRSVLQSPRLSRFQHDRARRVAYVIDGLFGIGFLVPIRRVRGFMLHGGSLIIESVSSDFCFVLLPPVLLFFARPLVPRSLSRGPLRCLRFALFLFLCFLSCSSFLLPASSPYISVLRHVYVKVPTAITKIIFCRECSCAGNGDMILLLL